MRKALCLILKHRLRVVQEFGPHIRRLKCERCGGDWGMSDIFRIVIEWDPHLEQVHRDAGFEILEPMAPLPPPVEPGVQGCTALAEVQDEPLTRPEWVRACRWLGAFAMALGYSAGHIVQAIGFGLAARLIAVAAISYATMRLLMPHVYRRAYERKRNSLQA